MKITRFTDILSAPVGGTLAAGAVELSMPTEQAPLQDAARIAQTSARSGARVTVEIGLRLGPGWPIYREPRATALSRQ